jgi:hypothetical protein
LKSFEYHPEVVDELSAPFRSRREFLIDAGLVAIGFLARPVVGSILNIVRSEPPSTDTMSRAEFDEILKTGAEAKKQAKLLQEQINATIQSGEPTAIPVVDDSKIIVWDRVGNQVGMICAPILLGDSPRPDDLDKNFWFGIQYPDPGGVGKPPSVGIRAELFDPDRMSLSYFVPAGQDRIDASQMDVLVMPPDPEITANNVMVAYGYNQYEPDKRQRRYDDPSQLLAPGLQVPYA